jgi:hypothetical protein
MRRRCWRGWGGAQSAREWRRDAAGGGLHWSGGLKLLNRHDDPRRIEPDFAGQENLCANLVVRQSRVANDALFLRPDDQAMLHRRQLEIGTQLGGPIPCALSGDSTSTSTTGSETLVASPGRSGPQRSTASGTKSLLSIGMVMPSVKASQEVSPALPTAAAMHRAPRPCGGCGGPLGRHRDHDAVDALEPAGRLLLHPGQELLPGHGGLGLMGLGA